MKQTTFASLALERKKKQTRRERFLTEMEKVVPWAALLAAIESMRRFAGLDLTDDAMPDETTIVKFRHLLEKHGLLLKGGAMVDATIIHAPPRRRTGTSNAIRRCIRPRWVTSGTSA